MENFTIETTQTQSELVKLIDFGFSKRFGKKADHHMNAVVGTPIYVAPEVFKGYYDF